MSFGLARGRELDPGRIGVDPDALPPLPDDVHLRPEAGRLDPRAWFERPERPFEIEIGAGKGAFLVGEAEARPRTNFLAFEWAKEFALYTADRCRRRGLSNVRILCADATQFLHWRTPDGICRVIHLYFSDPWPKARHHKRRVVQDPFLGDAHRVLEPGGELRIVTDHDGYWAWMERHFQRWSDPRRDGPRFERLPFDAARRPGGAREGELVGTNFERKYTREGRPFHAVTLRKPAPGG